MESLTPEVRAMYALLKAETTEDFDRRFTEYQATVKKAVKTLVDEAEGKVSAAVESFDSVKQDLRADIGELRLEIERDDEVPAPSDEFQEPEVETSSPTSALAVSTTGWAAASVLAATAADISTPPTTFAPSGSGGIASLLASPTTCSSLCPGGDTSTVAASRMASLVLGQAAVTTACTAHDGCVYTVAQLDMVSGGTSMNQLEAKINGMCSGLGYHTTNSISISLFQWDPGEQTRASRNLVVSRDITLAACVNELNEDSSGSSDHYKKPGYARHHPDFPGLIQLSCLGENAISKCFLKGNSLSISSSISSTVLAHCLYLFVQYQFDSVGPFTKQYEDCPIAYAPAHRVVNGESGGELVFVRAEGADMRMEFFVDGPADVVGGEVLPETVVNSDGIVAMASETVDSTTDGSLAIVPGGIVVGAVAQVLNVNAGCLTVPWWLQELVLFLNDFIYSMTRCLHAGSNSNLMEGSVPGLNPWVMSSDSFGCAFPLLWQKFCELVSVAALGRFSLVHNMLDVVELTAIRRIVSPYKRPWCEAFDALVLNDSGDLVLNVSLMVSALISTAAPSSWLWIASKHVEVQSPFPYTPLPVNCQFAGIAWLLSSQFQQQNSTRVLALNWVGKGSVQHFHCGLQGPCQQLKVPDTGGQLRFTVGAFFRPWDPGGSASTTCYFDNVRADDDYYYNGFLDLIGRHLVLFNLVQVPVNHGYYRDYSSKQERQVQWDPGGDILSRLGGKPNFMEGGLSAIFSICCWVG